MMTSAKLRAKSRAAMKQRAESIEEEETEGGEINLVPYLDIVTNVTLFLLATISAGFVLGNINTALPEYAATSGALENQNAPSEPPLQLVVAITKPEIMMFSLSGLEGTLQQPRLRLPATKPGEIFDYAKLTTTALEIVKKRWPDKTARPEVSTELILMADGNIPYHVIVNAMDALRQSTDGTVLFPGIIFSTGIQ